MKNELKNMNKLSDGAKVVLLALLESVDDTKGDFGFIEDAYSYLRDESISSQGFAAHIGHLYRADWIFEHVEDLSQDPGCVCNATQFVTKYGVYEELLVPLRTEVNEILG